MMMSTSRSRQHTNAMREQSTFRKPFFAKPSSNDIQTKRESAFFQTKLSIGKSDDKYEREADAVANTVVNQKQITPLTQQKIQGKIQRLSSAQEEEKLSTNDARMRKDKEIQEKPEVERMCSECEKEAGLQKMNDEKKEEEMVQQKSDSNTTASSSLSSRIENSSGRGKQLPAKTLTEMNSSFGTDFSNVNVHNNSDAVQMNKELSAQAFTHGRDIYFNSGKYNTETSGGKQLLAHELTHVIQQTNLIQRQSTSAADVKKAKPYKINYKSAKASNTSFSKPNSLGWATKLETIAGGTYKEWFELWKNGKYDEFADTVAQYQSDHGSTKKEIDGILGLDTWSKIAGYGEAMAGIQTVEWERSKDTCTIASEERIKKGHKLAKGSKFELPKDKSEKTFNIILQTIESKMGDIDEMYRGTGAAGAMVYAGLGTFVAESDIWTGGLRPGAAMQVWGDRDGYNLLRKGVFEYKVKGVTKTRPLKPDDANFYGTSFVFVRYDDPSKPTKMLVRHFDSPEWKSKSDYAVWVGANIN